MYSGQYVLYPIIFWNLKQWTGTECLMALKYVVLLPQSLIFSWVKVKTFLFHIEGFNLDAIF